MSYRALEGYFAPAREAWLAEQRAMEAEAQARGVSAEQVKYEHREAAKEREHAAQAMRNASMAEALRRQVALDAEAERAEQARQEAKAQQAAEQLAAQQAWWAAVAQGDYQTEPPMTEPERQAHAPTSRRFLQPRLPMLATRRPRRRALAGAVAVDPFTDQVPRREERKAR
jgi:hypothetical protein